MVSTLPLCVTVGLALCQSNTMSEDITQQKHYSELTATDVEQMIEEITVPNTYESNVVDLETIEYINGYYDYVEEQERLEQERIAEEQRRLEEEAKQRELERIAWENRFDRKDYRQTYYSVVDVKPH